MLYGKIKKPGEKQLEIAFRKKQGSQVLKKHGNKNLGIAESLEYTASDANCKAPYWYDVQSEKK